MHSQSFVPFALLAGLQIADAYLTWRVLANGGRELNPVVRILMKWFGVAAGLMLAKAALLAAAALWLGDHVVLILLLVALYSWVVMNNWKQLSRKTSKPLGG
jgi:hypothetical protein